MGGNTVGKKLGILMLVDFMASSMGSTEDEYKDIEGEMTQLFPECDLTFKHDFFVHLFDTIGRLDCFLNNFLALYFALFSFL